FLLEGFLLLGLPVLEGHTISAKLESLKLTDDIPDENGTDEYFVNMIVNFGGCDGGQSIQSIQPKGVILKFEHAPPYGLHIDQKSSDCFRKIPEGQPWPEVWVNFTVLELDDTFVDQDFALRVPTDSIVPDFGDESRKFSRVACPKSPATIHGKKVI